jgi:hypothetical protein
MTSKDAIPIIGCSFATLSITTRVDLQYSLRRRVGFYHQVAALRNLRACLPQYLLNHFHLDLSLVDGWQARLPSGRKDCKGASESAIGEKKPIALD